MADDTMLLSAVDLRMNFSVIEVVRQRNIIEPKRFLLIIETRKMRMTTISRLIKFGLYIYGIWPYVPSTVVFRVYWIAMMSAAQIFQYGFVVVNVGMEDFSQFMDGFSSALTSTVLYIKLIILWINQQIFYDLLQMMSADWQNYTSSHYNSSIMSNTSNRARRASRWIVGLYTFSAVTYSFGVLAANVGDPARLQPYNRELILKMALPFNISTNFIYNAVQAVQFYHLFLVGFGITTVNSLIVTLILHVGGQIDILREWLLKAFSKDSASTGGKITVQTFITKHQQIIAFSENIESLYTYIALMILLSDTIIICCLGYVIATSIKTPNAVAILVKSVIYYLSINIETFIYCFSGEYLSAKSQLIGYAAYDSLWYNFPTKESKIVIFVILRAQKKLMITSGRIVDLSLDRFTSVIKASASYMSVLLAMY